MPRRPSLGSCYQTIKYIMFFFNLIFWILGCVLLGIGIYIKTNGAFGEILANKIPQLYTGAYLLIVVGIIMMTAFLGCYGALRESQCLLFSFFLILFMVFTLLMAAGLWAEANKTKIEIEVHSILRNAVSKYSSTSDKKNEETVFMDYVQTELSCCGVTGANDYSFAPKSCGDTPRVRSSRPGCFPTVVQFGRDNLYRIVGAGIGISVVIMFGMVLSMMLCCALKEVNG